MPREARSGQHAVSGADEGQPLILSGLSGAGKTTALKAFEDLGFFAADNVPPQLWLPLAVLARDHGAGRLVVAVDVRTERFLGGAEQGLQELRAAGFSPLVLFLTADEAALVRRYRLTRRSHPLGEGTLLRDLARERTALAALEARADLVLDTTDMSAAQLRAAVDRHYGGGRAFRLHVLSFGFKRGAPLDADTTLDVRTMTNPYYDADLRGLPGTDPRVAACVFDEAGLEEYADLAAYVRGAVRRAVAAGRSAYTVAIGCTGGQHRSVAVAERLVVDLGDEFLISGEHRDLDAALGEHGP